MPPDHDSWTRPPSGARGERYGNATLAGEPGELGALTVPWLSPSRASIRDLAGQVAQALRNTARGLAGADASFADVVRLRFFVTDWSPEKIDDFMAGIHRVADELGLPQPLPPVSLIGVDYLFEPDVLVEVEAFAVLD